MFHEELPELLSGRQQALARRGQLRPGEAIYTRQGHAVGAHGVSFYAPDSEQAGLLARAQEIENLDKALKAQFAPKFTQENTTSTDTEGETILMKMASEKATDSFVKVANSL